MNRFEQCQHTFSSIKELPSECEDSILGRTHHYSQAGEICSLFRGLCGNFSESKFSQTDREVQQKMQQNSQQFERITKTLKDVCTDIEVSYQRGVQIPVKRRIQTVIRRLTSVMDEHQYWSASCQQTLNDSEDSPIKALSLGQPDSPPKMQKEERYYQSQKVTAGTTPNTLQNCEKDPIRPVKLFGVHKKRLARYFPGK